MPAWSWAESSSSFGRPEGGGAFWDGLLGPVEVDVLPAAAGALGASLGCAENWSRTSALGLVKLAFAFGGGLRGMRYRPGRRGHPRLGRELSRPVL